MYCKTCGRKNRDEDIYCIEDGSRLEKTYLKDSIHSIEGENCRSCGNQGEKADVYCRECGKAYFEFGKKKKNKKRNILERGVYGIIVMVIIGILAYLSKDYISTRLSQSLNNNFSFNLFEGGASSLEIISILNGALFMAEERVPFLSSKFIIELGLVFFAFLSIPLLVSGLVGFFKASRDRSRDLTGLVSNSLIYGLLTAVVASFTWRDVKILSVLHQRLEFKAGVSSIRAFIYGTIVCLVGMLIGYSFYILIKKVKMSNIYGEEIVKAGSIYGIVSLVFLILLYIYLTRIVDLARNPLIVSQIAVYLLALVNFGEVSYIQNTSSIRSYSFFGGQLNIESFLGGGLGFLIFLTSLLVLIFFVQGFLSGKRGKKYYIIPMVYSILTTIMARIMAISIKLPLMSSIEVRTNIVRSFLGVLVLTLLPATIGYFVARRFALKNKEDTREEVAE